MPFYGIDVAKYQATLDMAVVAAQGNKFSGVKAVAANEAQLQIADEYHNNVDRIMAAGLFKYHYTTINSQNSPEATAQFLWSIKYRYEPTDKFMLDNEPLDRYATFWGDDFVDRFWREMLRLGMRIDQGIEYCPAALTRAQSWPKLKALELLGLITQWVSYGDNDPYYEDGEEPYLGNTGLNPRMHQFTSSYTVPGYTGLIDRVFVSDANPIAFFGGGTQMPRTPNGAFAWAAYEGANGNIRTDWGGWCEAFIHHAGAFSETFGRAIWAADASGPMRGDYANAPRGAIVWWNGVFIGGIEYGHVAFVYEAGADPLMLMASNAAKSPAWGHGIGLIRLSAYQRLFGHPLRGWTLRHGSQTLDFSGTAGGGGYDPIEEDDMYTDADRARDNNTAGFLWAGGISAEDPDYLGMPGTVYNLLKAPVVRQGDSQPTAIEDGVPVSITQVQDNADTNTIVRQLRTELVAVKSALLALATGTGDPEGIKAAITEAVHEAISETNFVFDGAGKVVAGA